MSELRQLYQEMILDHYKHPRNFHALDDATHSAVGDNPLCGDKVSLFLRIEDGRIAAVGFQGAGCAISTASASLLTQAVAERPVEEVRSLYERVHRMLTQGELEPEETEALGKLAVFEGVREYPARVKCATLCWHALRAALDGGDQPVTTE